MILKRVPEKWEVALGEIQSKAWTARAVIAGGSILSLFHPNHIPKDVDIFVIDPDRDEFITLWTFIGNPPEIPPNNEYDIDAKRYAWKKDGVTYDIIIIQSDISTNELLERFDIGICKCAFDGESFILNKMFLDDMTDRKITVAHDSSTTAYRIANYTQEIGFKVR